MNKFNPTDEEIKAAWTKEVGDWHDGPVESFISGDEILAFIRAISVKEEPAPVLDTGAAVGKLLENYRFAQFAADNPYMAAMPEWLRKDLYAGLDALEKPAFRVGVVPLEASNGVTYVVCLDRGDRAENAKPWDDGRMTPINRNSFSEANYEGAEWAKFLGVEFTPCTPIMGVEPNTVPEYGGNTVNMMRAEIDRIRKEVVAKCAQAAYNAGVKCYDMWHSAWKRETNGKSHGLPFIHNDVHAAVVEAGKELK